MQLKNGKHSQTNNLLAGTLNLNCTNTRVYSQITLQPQLLRKKKELLKCLYWTDPLLCPCCGLIHRKEKLNRVRFYNHRDVLSSNFNAQPSSFHFLFCFVKPSEANIFQQVHLQSGWCNGTLLLFVLLSVCCSYMHFCVLFLQNKIPAQ